VPAICSSTVVAPTTDPEGRKQIAVDQQQGGTQYPFICPPNNLDLLIGDLYLNYKDPQCILENPFKIDWLSGFGGDAAANPTGQVHEYDLLISDAQDRVVFDTRDATEYKKIAWGIGKVILEWATADGEVLRVVFYRTWSPEDTPITWACYFEPVEAILDPRSYQMIPKLVQSISIVTDITNPLLDTAVGEASKVIFQGGYNTEFLIEDPEIVDGGKLIRGLTVDFDPGAGLGQYPGCDEEERYIRRINETEPDDRGNLLIDATDCYRLERPIADSESSSSAISGVYSGAYRNVDVVKATLKFSNDCGPCCDCEDFINVYEGIRKLDNKYQELGQRAEIVRDLFRTNKSRWETQIACRVNDRLRIAMQPVAPCRLAVAVALCNGTDEPLKNPTLNLAFSASRPGCVVCNTTWRKGNVDASTGTPPARSKPYKLGGSWPNFTAQFDCINPAEQGYVSFVLQFDGCQESDNVVLNLTCTDCGDLPAARDETGLIRDPDTGDCCEPSSTEEQPPIA